jgi:hypothetical protein
VGSWPNILFYAVTLEQPKCRPASPLAINSFVYYANTSLATQVLNCVEHCAARNLFCRRAEPPSDAQSPRNDRILQIVRSHGHIRGQDQPITHLLVQTFKPRFWEFRDHSYNRTFGGPAKARPNLSESAELQTDLARTSPTLG